MAERAAVVERINPDAVLVTWTGVTNADTFGALSSDQKMVLGEYPDRTVQMTGIFDTGSVDLKGSIDGTNYETLNDGAGAPLSFTAAGLKSVLEYTTYVQPERSGGGASMSVAVWLLARRQRRLGHVAV